MLLVDATARGSQLSGGRCPSPMLCRSGAPRRGRPDDPHPSPQRQQAPRMAHSARRTMSSPALPTVCGAGCCRSKNRAWTAHLVQLRRLLSLAETAVQCCSAAETAAQPRSSPGVLDQRPVVGASQAELITCAGRRPRRLAAARLWTYVDVVLAGASVPNHAVADRGCRERCSRARRGFDTRGGGRRCRCTSADANILTTCPCSISRCATVDLSSPDADKVLADAGRDAHRDRGGEVRRRQKSGADEGVGRAHARKYADPGGWRRVRYSRAIEGSQMTRGRAAVWAPEQKPRVARTRADVRHQERTDARMA